VALKLQPNGLMAWILLPACLLTLIEATSASAVTPTEADTAFRSLNQVYWDATIKFFRKQETGEKKADFWLEAQLWDTVMDQYDRTRSETVKEQLNDVYDGFMAQYPASAFNLSASPTQTPTLISTATPAPTTVFLAWAR
jgi:hypothetical protein